MEVFIHPRGSLPSLGLYYFSRDLFCYFFKFAGGIFISLLKKIKIHGVGVGAGVPEKVAGQSGLLAEGQGEYVKVHA